MKIAFFGLGKLGLPVALAVEQNHLHWKFDDSVGKIEVKAYDPALPLGKIDNQLIANLHEDLSLLAKRETDIVIEEPATLVPWADLIFVAVQTPHDPKFEGTTRLPDERKDFDYTYLQTALKSITDIDKGKTIVVISTVLPGTFNEQFSWVPGTTTLIYNPFFIAMGTVVRDFREPEFVLLGSKDGDVNPLVHKFYQNIYGVYDTRQYWTTRENAELIKVAYNTFIGMKIVFANTLMEICHKMPNMDVDDVSNALSLATDRLISKKYLRGGMGDAGGCFLPDEEILTEAGFKKIKEINIGEKVMTHDGSFQVVNETYKRPYKGDVLKIFDEISSSTVTLNHPFLVRFPTFGPREVKAIDLRIGQSIWWPDELPNERRHIIDYQVIKYEGTVFNLNVDKHHTYICRIGTSLNCHPRDNIAMSWLANKLHLSANLFEDIMAAREDQTEWLATLIYDVHKESGLPVVLMGETFKANSTIKTGSCAVLLRGILLGFGITADYYDPYTQPRLPANKPHIFFISTNHDAFVNFKFPKYSIVIDPWRYLSPMALRQNLVHYIGIGETIV